MVKEHQVANRFSMKMQIMLQQYRRQEDIKRLENDDDDTYLNSKWADNTNLEQQFHGIQNINFVLANKQDGNRFILY